MPLFTFIAAYRGGVYISQVTSPDVEAAVFAWAEALDVSTIPKVKPKHKKKLVRLIRREADWYQPAPLDETVNAWCYSTLLRDKFMLINIVRTEQSE